MDDDPALDPIRELPAFADVMRAGGPDRQYAAVWTSDATFETELVAGLNPAEQLRRARNLAGQGYRPVAWSAAPTTPQRRARYRLNLAPAGGVREGKGPIGLATSPGGGRTGPHGER